VRKGKTVEIGFREVTPTEAGLGSPLRGHVAGVPDDAMSVTPWLPSGAVRLSEFERVQQ
jgi:hypothetical protein